MDKNIYSELEKIMQIDDDYYKSDGIFEIFHCKTCGKELYNFVYTPITNFVELNNKQLLELRILILNNIANELIETNAKTPTCKCSQNQNVDYSKAKIYYYSYLNIEYFCLINFVTKVVTKHIFDGTYFFIEDVEGAFNITR